MEADDMSKGLLRLLPDIEDILDEESLIRLFTERVEVMMREDIDLLLSSLYRLDIDELKIQKALRSTDIPVAEGLARLIIERQKEKIRTRRQYGQDGDDPWKGIC